MNSVQSLITSLVAFAESGFIKMKKIVTFMFLAVMMALFVESCGAEMRIQGAHVYGENEIDGRWILYDFDVPKEVETVKQYKTEFVKMNLSLVKSILEKYVQKPRSMDAWNLINSNQWNDTNFCYFEQNGRYTCEGSYYRGPRKNADTEPVRLASEKVYNLLEELNISDFEYPFYVETSQCKLIETVFEKIESEDDYIRVKGDTDSMAAEYYDKEVLGKERSIIVTRFLIDGIPLCISDTSPHKRNSDLDDVTGSEGIFVLNENNEMIRAQIRNYVRVVKSKEDDRRILPWQECIDVIAQGMLKDEKVMVTEVELNLVVGTNGMTYPVWKFSGYSDLNELRKKDTGIVIRSSDFSCCVDAYSGQCLYY